MAAQYPGQATGNPFLMVGAPIRAPTVRSCETFTRERNCQAKAPAPRSQANDLPVEAQALLPARRIISQVLSERVCGSTESSGRGASEGDAGHARANRQDRHSRPPRTVGGAEYLREAVFPGASLPSSTPGGAPYGEMLLRASG